MKCIFFELGNLIDKVRRYRDNFHWCKISHVSRTRNMPNSYSSKTSPWIRSVKRHHGGMISLYLWLKLQLKISMNGWLLYFLQNLVLNSMMSRGINLPKFSNGKMRINSWLMAISPRIVGLRSLDLEKEKED